MRRLFRLLGATTVATIAAAYVPPHMELPANGIWADIGAGSVSSLREPMAANVGRCCSR